MQNRVVWQPKTKRLEDEIEFLEPETFYSCLNGLGDDEEIFCQICPEHPEHEEIYNKIQNQYGIRQ